MSEEKSLVQLSKEIKKVSGKEAALDFLFSSEIDLKSDLAEYLERVKIYSVGSKKYSQSAILSFFDQVISRMPLEEVWRGYQQKAEIFERFGFNQDATNTYRLAISNLSPFYAGYLHNLSRLQRKFGELCPKDEDYIFWTLTSDLLISAWDLSCCMSGKLELWIMSLDVESYPYPVAKPSFANYLGPVTVLGKNFEDSRLEESLIRFNRSISSSVYKERVIKMIEVEYPERLGFKRDYFEPEFSDKNFFNGILEIYGRDFNNAFNAKAVSLASDIVNEFLKEICFSEA